MTTPHAWIRQVVDTDGVRYVALDDVLLALEAFRGNVLENTPTIDAEDALRRVTDAVAAAFADLPDSDTEPTP